MPDDSTILYAWVNPLSIDNKLDHTWVTNYKPPPIYDKITDLPADHFYWYCWGDYHPEGHSAIYPEGAIGSAPGNLGVSSCICAPNDPKAHGSIFIYGIDGVCHQLANQALYSTNGPLTVNKARGYDISSFLFGTYGSNKSDWDKLRQKCSATAGGGGPLKDDFVEKASERLKDDPQKMKDLLAIRENFQAEMEKRREQEIVSAEDFTASANETIQSFLAQTAELLGPEDYKALFEFNVGEEVSLVDLESARMFLETTKKPA